MASMDGGARNVLSDVAAAGRALKETPATTWDARPGADATAPRFFPKKPYTKDLHLDSPANQSFHEE